MLGYKLKLTSLNIRSDVPPSLGALLFGWEHLRIGLLSRCCINSLNELMLDLAGLDLFFILTSLPWKWNCADQTYEDS